MSIFFISLQSPLYSNRLPVSLHSCLYDQPRSAILKIKITVVVKDPDATVNRQPDHFGNGALGKGLKISEGGREELPEGDFEGESGVSRFALGVSSAL